MSMLLFAEKGRVVSAGSRIYLGGASGVGKTSVARVLGKRLNLPVYEVEARECWEKPAGVERQKCFAMHFFERMRKGPGVYTNHLIAVYGYTRAMGVEGELVDELRIGTEMFRDKLVVLAIRDKDEMLRRILERYSKDRDRSRNVVEKEIDLHYTAQKFIIDFAVELGVPVIYMDGKSVEEVAKKVINVIHGTP
jgi:adenylate kinase family enzyme